MHERLTPSSFPSRVLAKGRGPLKKGGAIFHVAGAVCGPPRPWSPGYVGQAHASSFPWPKGCVCWDHAVP